jgi:hypothetical protein
MKSRFRDTGKTIYEFGHEFLVHCPRCDNCARVVPKDREDTRNFAPRRLICQKCGYTQDWHITGKPPGIEFNYHRPPRDLNSIGIGGSFDWYFRLPLWLQTPCCGEILWAYNKEHLDFLENYVKAGLRESFPLKVYETERVIWRNKSLASRLPTWMKRAKNRDEVLRGIERLRKKIE